MNRQLLAGSIVLMVTATGCSNVIRAGLMNSNTVFLDPSSSRTAYVQARNTSENQTLALSILTKLTAKGYQVMTDPAQANYWIQAKVVYCHQAADGVTPESVAQAGFGAGIGTGGSVMASAGGMGGPSMGIQAMKERMAGGAMPDMNAMMRMAMAGGGGFPGMQPPPKEEGVTYLCVADIRITDHKGKTASASNPMVQQMRTVGHVRQKELDIPEATPIIQEKISSGIAGLF
jgi:hypothetical protein